eukprot:scaffold36857_cov20-Tisochrysis_lutea.AAC.1
MEEMCKSSYAAQAKKNKGHKRKSGSKNLIACLSVAMLARKRISRVLRMPGVQLQAAEGERGCVEVCPGCVSWGLLDTIKVGTSSRGYAGDQ